jgi:uncharacterized protein with HEPN domain
MAFQDPRTRLAHILDAVKWIERMTAGRSREDYRRDRVLRDFVERNPERISEASRHLPEQLKAEHPRLLWHDIAAIGNRPRHGYDSIDDDTLWSVVTLELPTLRAATEQMLRRYGNDP